MDPALTAQLSLCLQAHALKAAFLEVYMHVQLQLVHALHSPLGVGGGGGGGIGLRVGGG